MKSRRICQLGLSLTAIVLFVGCNTMDPSVMNPAPNVPGPENGSLKIYEVSPTQIVAGNQVIALIHGAGFKPWLKVRFGNVESSSVKVFDESMLTAVVPQQPPGSFDVTLSDAADGTERLVALQDAVTVLSDLPAGTDNDNLSDSIELNGWDIEVDRFGFGLDPAHIIRYTVTSDPDLDDTDGDGLSDAEEYLNKTNPRNVDTDGDGLWDGEEVHRWGTSPVTVDTDGDASGGGTSSPYASMFDGMELYSPDQLILPPSERGHIRGDATSPSLADTDGDGASDGDEDPSTVRRPLFADLPKLRARIVDAMDIRLDVEYAEEQGQTTGYSSELSTAQETTVGRSETETASVSVTVGVEAGYEGGAAVAKVNVETTVGYENSVETSKESTESASQTYGKYAEDSRVKSESAASGSMSAGLEIVNEGNVAFRLTSLGMAVRQLQPVRDPLNLSTPPEFKTFATLRPDLSNGLTLAPGAPSGVLQVQATDVNADRIKTLLASPSRMVIDPAVFEIEDANGINFAFVQEVTQARTARVLLDFGNGEVINTRIATNVDRLEDGTLAGITLANVMDQLLGAGNWESRTASAQDTIKILWRVKNVENDLDSTPRLWRVYVNSDDQLGKDFDDVVLHFGDAVIIALTEDADGDGLSSVQEQHYGTADNSTDTDGDGLSDALETRGEYRVPALPTGQLRQGGWTVTVPGGTPYRVFSDPTRADSDGDGLTDRQEYLGKDGIAPGAAGDHNDATDPLLADTDGDGINDLLDLSIVPATVLYVKSSATGANNGSNWTNAYTQLASALTTARTRNTDADTQNDIGEIWVAQGVYAPPTLNTSFSIPPRVAIYGGFTGGETKRSQRNDDPVSNGSVLHANGTFIVTAASPLPGQPVLDGFMLEAAPAAAAAMSINFTDANDSISVQHCFFYNNNITGQFGAGIRAVGTLTNGVANTIQIEDCTFANNRNTAAYAVGAAVSTWVCSPQIRHCTFFGNITDATTADATTGTNGGAVWIYRSPTFIVDDCRFEQNMLAAGGIPTSSPASGGALSIVSLGATPTTGTISNCVFRNNEVESELTTNPGTQWWSNRAGGALSTCVNQNSGTVSINVINCAFWQNRAQCFGGGAYVGPSTTAKFVNCTFNRNVLNLLPSTASNCGSTQLVDSFAVGAAIGALGTAIVDNCVLWGNVGSDTMRTRPAGGGTIVTRNLGQEKQISPRPYWPLLIECFGSAGTVSFNNNCVEKVGLDVHFTGSVGGLGNIGLDPSLGSQDTGNLVLTAGSPCIDSGNNLVDADNLKGGLQFLPGTDLAAKSRKVDGNGDGVEEVDMGAYEFQP